jgi:hypothetical protein
VTVLSQGALSLEEVGTPCVDGSPLTALDVERIDAATRVQLATLRGALYAVAGSARDAHECRVFLDMVGIDLDTVRRLRTEV